MKNKLSLLLLISAFSLGLKANDSIRKRTVNISLINNYLDPFRSKFKVQQLANFELKCIFGKGRLKQLVSLSVDRFESLYKYEISNNVFVGYKQPLKHYKLVNVDQTIVYNYYNVGYGVLKEFRLGNKFLLLPSSSLFFQFYRTYRSTHQFYDFYTQIPDEQLIKETKIKYLETDRIGLNLSLNGQYKLSKQLSLLGGISVSVTRQDFLKPDVDKYTFFTKDFANSVEYYNISLYPEPPNNSPNPFWRIFASINLGLNYTIR